MLVQGRKITQQQIDACVVRMKLRAFTAWQLTIAAQNAGVEGGETAMRFADRMIQRERKAGRIAKLGRDWKWRTVNGSGNP